MDVTINANNLGDVTLLVYPFNDDYSSLDYLSRFSLIEKRRFDRMVRKDS